MMEKKYLDLFTELTSLLELPTVEWFASEELLFAALVTKLKTTLKQARDEHKCLDDLRERVAEFVSEGVGNAENLSGEDAALLYGFLLGLGESLSPPSPEDLKQYITTS